MRTEHEGKKLIVIASNHEIFQQEVTSLFQGELQSQGDFEFLTIQEVLEQRAGCHPAGVIVDLDHRREAGDSVILTVQKIADYFPGVKIVCAGSSLDVPFILKLVRVGASDFLKVPFDSAEVATVMRQISLNAASSAQPGAKNGRLITLFSPKGGVGVTLIAANLAVALARRKSDRVGVCDLMPQCGDVATYMNLTPKYTIRDLIDQQEQMDSSLIQGVLAQHASGIHVMAAPKEEQGPLGAEAAEGLQNILTLMKRDFNFILVDAGHLDSPLLSVALKNSDDILLMGNLDVPSLRGLLYSFNYLMKFRYDTNKIKVIINRYNTTHQLNITEFQRKTKHPIACFLPNAYALCIDAVNTGRLLRDIKGSHDLVREIDRLAEYLRSENAPRQAPAAAVPAESTAGMRENATSFLKGIFRCLF